MNAIRSITLDKVSLPVYSHPNWTRFPLLLHQIHALNAKSPFMMCIPTGLGKTFAGVIPSLVEGRHKTFFVFPSNALVETQYNSVKKRLAEWGEKIHSIKLTGDDLLIYMMEEGFETKGEALWHLLTQYEKNIIFTNIDIMFNIVALRYSKRYAKDIAATLKSSRIIFDEFHFYKNITALLLGILYQILLDFTRDISFLSATPSKRIVELLDQIHPTEKIELKEEKSGDTTLIYPVRLTVALPSENDIQRGFEWLKSHYAKGKLGMAIVDSIRDSMLLYRKLKAENLKVFLYNGILKDEIDEATNEGIIVGTSAIEVGIDKSVDYLFFEAENLASFLQRFGRVGRHSEGKAFGIVHPEIFYQIVKSSQEGSVHPRLTFLDKLVSHEYRFNYLELYHHSEFTPILKNIEGLYDPDRKLSDEERTLLRLLSVRDSVATFILGKREGKWLLITYDILRAIRDYKIKKFYFGSNARERIGDLDKLSQLRFEYYSEFFSPLILEIDEFTEPSENKLMVKYKEPFIFQPYLQFLQNAFGSLYKRGLYKPAILNRTIIEEGCVKVEDFSDKQKVWVFGFSSKLLESTIRKGVFI